MKQIALLTLRWQLKPAWPHPRPQAGGDLQLALLEVGQDEEKQHHSTPGHRGWGAAQRPAPNLYPDKECSYLSILVKTGQSLFLWYSSLPKRLVLHDGASSRPLCQAPASHRCWTLLRAPWVCCCAPAGFCKLQSKRQLFDQTSCQSAARQGQGQGLGLQPAQLGKLWGGHQLLLLQCDHSVAAPVEVRVDREFSDATTLKEGARVKCKPLLFCFLKKKITKSKKTKLGLCKNKTVPVWTCWLCC